MKLKEIDRNIWRLALPATAGNISVPLLGLSDTAISGHLGNEAYLAAIAAGGMMMNVMVWLCGFLRMATVGITAAAHGAGDGRAGVTALWRATLLGCAIGVGVWIVQYPLLQLLLLLIAPSGEVAVLAARYFSICCWGLPAVLAVMGVSGWLIGMQNTLYPMLISVIVNALNVVFSLVAVFGMHAGFEGVAFGTLAANACAVPVALFFVRRVRVKFGLSGGQRVTFAEIVKGDGLRRFFSMSSELFVRSACIMGVSMTVTAIGARLGDTVLAANALLMQFFIFYSYFMDGLAYAGEALCGNRAGAADRRGLNRVVRRLLVWGGSLTLLFTVACLAGYSRFLGLLTDSESVISFAQGMKWFIVVMPLISGWAFVFDGVYVGLSATRRMLYTTMAATAVFAVVIFLFPQGGNPALWGAFLTYLAIRGIGLAAQYPSVASAIK